MQEKYANWIENWLKNHDPYLKCAEATNEMIVAFSELKRIRGHVITECGHERPHWWLVDENGDIVDPTESQFAFIAMYIPYDESFGEPTGKCPHCGKLCYDHRFCCSDECDIAYAKYVRGD